MPKWPDGWVRKSGMAAYVPAKGILYNCGGIDADLGGN